MRLRRARPEAEVRRLLMQLALMRLEENTPDSVETVRRDWQLAVKAFASREPVASVVQREVPTRDGAVRLRVYVPDADESPGPALVWFHGGGFVFGDLYTAGATCRALANASDATVVAVEYRLAPEHGLHEALGDCLAATRWVLDHAAELGVDPSRVAVGGDSAGGGLAALVAQRSVEGAYQLAAQVLVYPATDLTGRSASATEQMPGLLDDTWVTWIREQISTVTNLQDPSLSAVQATDLSRVAPAIILTAGFDPLRDEGIAYARRLTEQGVPVRHLHFPGQIHGFLSLDRVLSAGQYGLRRLGLELALAFAHGVEPGVEDNLPRLRDKDPLLWLRPEQRWRETKVGAIVVRERTAKSFERWRSSRRGRIRNAKA